MCHSVTYSILIKFMSDTHFPDELLASSSDSSSLSVSACLRAFSAAANIWTDRQT